MPSSNSSVMAAYFMVSFESNVDSLSMVNSYNDVDSLRMVRVISLSSYLKGEGNSADEDIVIVTSPVIELVMASSKVSLHVLIYDSSVLSSSGGAE